MSVTKIYADALLLTEDERAELIDRLLESLSTDGPSQLDPAWRAIVQRRSAELDAGTVKPIPWDEVRSATRKEIDEAANGDLEVIAVAHASREPGYWETRTEE